MKTKSYIWETFVGLGFYAATILPIDVPREIYRSVQLEKRIKQECVARGGWEDAVDIDIYNPLQWTPKP